MNRGEVFRATGLVTMLLLLSGCTGGPEAGGSTPTATVAVDGTTPASTGTSSARERIPQPDVGDLAVAPDSARVDLEMPTFTDPTSVSNPLFPVSSQASVLMVGRVDGQPFRTEVTLLPETKFVGWPDPSEPTEVLVSQYAAYLGGRLHEVAYDFYAQDDGGNVWYFGEDVFNFSGGAIVDTHGTWLAGRDGPAAMIMPADPQVGDVYRPENIPGFVFEEVTVEATDVTLPGPLGPVQGGLRILELHMDGATETKTFGPGYGEFRTGGGGDVEAIALAVPTDGLTDALPSGLSTVQVAAMDAYVAAGAGRWGAATASSRRATEAWAGSDRQGVPDNIEPQLGKALRALRAAVLDRSVRDAQEAAIETARWSLDVQLRYRPVPEVDLARMDLWAAQLVVDARARDATGMNDDFFSIDYVRDRLLTALAPEDLQAMHLHLEALIGAVGDGAFRDAAELAARLRGFLAGVSPA